MLRDTGSFAATTAPQGFDLEDFENAGMRVASVHKSTLTEVIKRRPDFAMKLFASLSERLRESDEVIESLKATLLLTEFVTGSIKVKY